MANDEAGSGGPIRDVPGRRRATYTPPVRRNSMAQPTDADTSPVEPPVEGGSEPGSAPVDAELETAPVDAEAATATSETTPNATTQPSAVSTLSDDELVTIIDADLASTGETLSAIQKLEGLLAARTAPIQSVPPGDAFAEVVVEPAAHDEPRPEPTFSSWIAPAAFLADPALHDEAMPTANPTRPQAPHEGDGAAEQDRAAALAEPTGSESEIASSEILGYSDAPPATADAAMVAMSVASVPVPVMQSVATGSHDVIDVGYDEDVVDDADDVPVAFEAILAPVASPRVGTDEEVLFDAQPIRNHVFGIEQPALEPTPLDYRVGRASRLFWLWFASTSSLITLAVGATLFAQGLNILQVMIATIVGIGLSFLPLGLGTLAGKWSGQPTMVVTRATFGLVGNTIPAVLALITRLFWGAVLLWIAGATSAAIAAQAGFTGMRSTAFLIGAGAVSVIAGVIAYFGYSLVAKVQLVLTVASAVLVVGFGVYTWHAVDVARVLAQPAGDWVNAAGGVVIVFSFLGLAWANSGGDLARYQRPASSGTASMGWATFGAALPVFLLVGYGGVLAASNRAIASGLLHDPVAALVNAGLPGWYPAPLLAAILLGLISSTVINIYSGGFALLTVGVHLPRQFSAGLVALGILLGAGALFLFAPDLGTILHDLVITLAVPTAAFAGIFSAEMIIRNRRFNPESLLRRGGVYADWRWANLATLVVASVAGYGFVRGTVAWLGWQGFLFPVAHIPVGSDLARADLGVILALVLGLIVPFAAGIPALRSQEGARR